LSRHRDHAARVVSALLGLTKDVAPQVRETALVALEEIAERLEGSRMVIQLGRPQQAVPVLHEIADRKKIAPEPTCCWSTRQCRPTAIGPEQRAIAIPELSTVGTLSPEQLEALRREVDSKLANIAFFATHLPRR
jgi:hypothetical protein